MEPAAQFAIQSRNLYRGAIEHKMYCAGCTHSTTLLHDADCQTDTRCVYVRFDGVHDDGALIRVLGDACRAYNKLMSRELDVRSFYRRLDKMKERDEMTQKRLDNVDKTQIRLEATLDQVWAKTDAMAGMLAEVLDQNNEENKKRKR